MELSIELLMCLLAIFFW